MNEQQKIDAAIARLLGQKYQVFGGTSYHLETELKVMQVLERVRVDHTRVRLHYGDTTTGLDWDEQYSATGHIVRSMGPTCVPILVYNSRSPGGGAILDHCIVKIVASKGGRVLYQHPTYHQEKETK